MKIVNIYNSKKTIYLFCREDDGSLKIIKDSSFAPYYYIKDEQGEYTAIDGNKVRKVIVNDPRELKELRSHGYYESDIGYCKKYCIDKIDKFDKTNVKWAMLDIEVMKNENEFPDPMTAKFPVTSISIYNSKYDKIRNWFVGDYIGKNETTETNILLAEVLLFKDFIEYMRKAKFDLLLGYYMEDFDYPYCFSSDTEVMTENGWTLLKDIVEQKLKIKIATLNPKTNKVEYHYPQDYIKYKYIGKMFHQGGKYINTLVTPNHRLWIKNKTHSNPKWHDYQLIEANQTQKSITFKKDFPLNNKKTKWFVLPKKKNSGWSKFRTNKKILMDDWLKFFGWYLSEGHLYNNNNRTIVISQSKTANPEKCKEIEQILDKMNIGWSYHGHTYCFSSVQIYSYLKQFGKSYDKFIPKELLHSLNKQQSLLLLETLIKGDGHYCGKERYSYCTASQQLAKDILELSLRSGFVARKHKYGKYYTIYINKRYFNHSPNRRIDLREYVEYNNYVYCLTVPNNLLYVRRTDNDYHWSGNCYNRFSKLEGIQKYLFEKESDYNNFATAISPIGKVRGGKKDYNNFYPAGTSIVDYLTWMKKIYKSEKSYSLDSIAEKYLKAGKKYKDMDFSKITEKVKLRNIDDVELMVKLEKEKFHFIPLFDEIRRFAKINWEDFGFNSRIIDALLLQEAKEKKIVLPNGKSYEATTDEFEGAYREVFESGRFFGVGKYDLSGAYPTLLQDLCLDSSNIITEKSENTIEVNVSDRETKEIKNTYLVKQDENALLPSAVKKVLTEKAKFKQLLKETPKDAMNAKDIKLTYDGVKNIINSFWGVLGNRFFRLYDARIAGMITSSIRDLLQYIKIKCEEHGYKVIYCDTDSIFTIDNNEDLTEFINKLIQQWSMEKFNKKITITIEREGSFEKLLILAMCRYIGYLKTEKGMEKEIKGVQAKRCLDPLSIIPTSKGYKQLKDIKIGNNIYNSYGKLTKVLDKVNNVHSEIMSIELEGKFPIISSLNHRFFIIRKNKELIVEAQTIKCGDYLEECIELIKENKNFCCFHLATILGFFYSEGCYNKNKKILRFSFHKKEEEMRTILVNAIKKLLKVKMHIYPSYNKSKVKVVQKVDNNFKVLEKYFKFNKKGSTSCKNHKIPSKILLASKQTIGQFLKCLFSGDGCITSKSIIYATNSKELFEGIKFLLKRIGIIFYERKEAPKLKNKRPNISYRLEIGKGEYFKYYNWIGFYGEKEEKLKIYILKKQKLTKCHRNNFYNGMRLKIVKRIKRIKKTMLLTDLTTASGDFLCDYIKVHNSDSTIFIAKFQDTLIDKILNKEPQEQIIDWIKTEIERLKILPLEEIAFPAKLSQAPELYKTEVTNKHGKTYSKEPPIFVRALKNTPELNKRVGDNYLWCYVKSEDPKKNVLAFDDTNKDHIKNIDFEKMQQRNILNISEVIFEAMKWDLSAIAPQKVRKSRKNVKNALDLSVGTSQIDDNKEKQAILPLKIDKII